MMQHAESLSSLDQAYQTEEFRQLGHQLIDLLADHLQNLEEGEGKAIPFRHPEEELAFWQEDLKNSGESPPIDFFRHLLQHSIQLHHPRNMGHQVAVPALISTFGGLFSDMLNNGSVVYEMGMASTALEKMVVDFAARELGFGEGGGGFLTSGGSLANLTAMLTARKAKAPSNVWQEGHGEKLAVMVSEESHYCIDRAARIMGLGQGGIIKVPVDDAFKIRTDLLESYYQEAKEEGYKVMAIVGCAASTSTGSYDDLEALALFAREKDLWFHVDGAHGASAAFAHDYRHLVRGIEKADSVTLDFHKMLMSPALSTGLIYKEGREAYRTFQQQAQYLWEAQQGEEWYNAGKRTFECTKFMISSKIYSIMRTYGKEVFGANVAHLYGKARAFADIVRNRADFELVIWPESNILTYRFVDAPEDQWNSLNAAIRAEMVQHGDFYLVQTLLRDNTYLRSTIMNPRSKEKDFSEMLDRLSEMARKKLC